VSLTCADDEAENRKKQQEKVKTKDAGYN